MLIVTKPVAQSYESSHASEIVLYHQQYAVSDVFDPQACDTWIMHVNWQGIKQYMDSLLFYALILN